MLKDVKKKVKTINPIIINSNVMANGALNGISRCDCKYKYNGKLFIIIQYNIV